MANAMDLPTLLYYADRSLVSELTRFLGSVDSKTKWSLRVTARQPRQSAETEIFKEDVANASLHGISSLVAKVEAEITNALGPSPECSLRFRAWDKGRAEKAPVNFMQRVTGELLPNAAGGEIALYRWMLERAARHESQAMNVLHANNATLVGLVADSHDTLSRVSTQRAVAATAADGAGGMSSVWQVVALMGFIVGWPALKKALAMPSSATVADVVKIAQLRLMTIQSDFNLADVDKKNAMPPVGSFEPPADDDPDSGGDPDGDPGPDGTGGEDGEGTDLPLIGGPLDIPGLLEQLKTDPETLMKLGAAIKADPVLSTAIRAISAET